jgi:hypothetical protein
MHGHYKIKDPILCFLTVILMMTRCVDVKDHGYKNLNMSLYTCMAYDCHSGTQLRIFPPISGRHLDHLGEDGGPVGLGCETCHFKYYGNLQHKNGFINGFNWLYNARTPGTIVFFDTDLPGATWDPNTGNCSGLPGGSCHGTENWY